MEVGKAGTRLPFLDPERPDFVCMNVRSYIIGPIAAHLDGEGEGERRWICDAYLNYYKVMYTDSIGAK